MKKFFSFFIVWISQNLAMPFWIVGHIHLSTNVYADIKEILASVGMNIIVLVGFIIDYRNSLKSDRTTITKKENRRT
tara:strand:+ start:1426 stop:1656 length:231 start_codon:yes stop_codon:yes gene_type:complete